MAERQKHGKDFENWVRETFTFNPPLPPTDEWDIRKALFRPGEHTKHTESYSGLNVSVKSRLWGEGVQFADVMRQFKINEDFLLIVGFWEKWGDVKRFKRVSVTRVVADDWQQLFAGVVPSDGSVLTPDKMGKKIEKLVNFVKYADLDKYELRTGAQKVKRTLERMSMSLHPKIDDEQRRVQCSLRFKLFMARFPVNQEIRTVDGEGRGTLWDVTVPDFY